MADVDFGTDVDCIDDHGLVFGLVSGQRNLANALLRRLKTPRGGLFYDLDYGLDLREYLNSTLTRGRIGEIIQAAESQCREDERVQEVTGTITREGFPSVTAKLHLEVETAEGEFALVLPISELAQSTSSAATGAAGSSGALAPYVSSPAGFGEELMGWP